NAEPDVLHERHAAPEQDGQHQCEQEHAVHAGQHLDDHVFVEAEIEQLAPVFHAPEQRAPELFLELAEAVLLFLARFFRFRIRLRGFRVYHFANCSSTKPYWPSSVRRVPSTRVSWPSK